MLHQWSWFLWVPWCWEWCGQIHKLRVELHQVTQSIQPQCCSLLLPWEEGASVHDRKGPWNIKKKTIRESTEEYLGGDFWFSNIRKFAQIFCLLKLFTDAARLWANRLQKTSRTKHWITFPDATPGDSTQESAGMTQEHISYVLKNLWFYHGNYFLWNRGMKWPELWHPPSVFFNKYMESIHLQFQPLLKQSTFFTSWIQIAIKLKVLFFFFKKLMWTQ